jgi:hypothetical protein
LDMFDNVPSKARRSALSLSGIPTAIFVIVWLFVTRGPSAASLIGLLGADHNSLSNPSGSAAGERTSIDLSMIQQIFWDLFFLKSNFPQASARSHAALLLLDSLENKRLVREGP